MKPILFFLLLISFNSFATTYYMSPNGSNSNPGTISSPWQTFAKANVTLVAGDILYVRGGTYLPPNNNAASNHFLIENLHGTSTDSISIRAYPGELPIFSCANIIPTYSDPYLMFISDCDYVHIVGFKVFYLRQNTNGSGISRGVSVSHCNNCTVERFDISCIGGQGLIIENNSTNTVIYRCDSHHNSDFYNAFDAADGFSCTGPTNFSTPNYWIECRSYMNSDDGYDNFNTNNINYYVNCLSYYNGFNPFGANGTDVDPTKMTPLDTSIFFSNPAYWTSSGEGFKLGKARVQDFNTITKYLTNCLAFMNRGTGYAANSLSQLSTRMSLINCVSYCCQNDGFSFGAGWQIGFSQIFKNCWSWLNNQKISGADYVYDGNNSLGGISNDVWMTTQGNVYGQLHPPINVSNADFLSVDQTTLTAPRQADGSYPISNFLRLAPTSDLLNAGIPAGLPYCGANPDINWVESCGLPTVSLGADRVLTLPTNSTVFTPTTSGGVTYQWLKYSGPNTYTITSPTTANTTIGNLVQGVYGFSLTVTNSSGSVTDSVLVTVNGAAPTPPTCSAGTTPVTITLPVNTVALSGTGASTNGNTVSYLWGFTLGTGTIANNTLASTTATMTTAGNYTISLLVTDNGNGLTCTSSKSVTVNPALVIPTANAGADQVITLPTNSVTLSGSGSGGTLNSYQWTLLSGVCSGCNFSAPTSATTNFTGLVAGVYSVRFRVGNTDGNYGYDTVQITVNPAVVPIVVTCNPDITITLPTNSCALVGTATGTSLPFTYLWTKITGTGGTLVTPTSLSCQFTGLSQGSYTIELKGTDNVGNISRDTMSVTVNAAPVITPPTANAGADQIIYLPTNSTTLTGSGTPTNGTITAYLWQKLPGSPTGGTITSSTSATTTITGLVAGTYQYSLTVTQTGGLQGTDTVTINVQELTPATGIRYLQASIYNNRDVYLGWTSNTTSNTQYFIVQRKINGVFQDVGARILPNPNVIDYWGYNDLVGQPKGTYYYRIMVSDRIQGKSYSSQVSVVKKK